tara:strand:+ start:62 stop:259 length:198 start_codon:yes stop_codon:yes gene_type:complete
MKYKFENREELLGMYNSIPTPHSHGIVIDGNNLIIEWDGDELDGWNKYSEVKPVEKVKSKKSKKK